MARTTALTPEEFYHVYNRGTEKRDVFMDEADYNRFLTLLYLANQSIPIELKLRGRTLEEAAGRREGEPIVDVACYCLMPNHIHLLMQERVEGGISKFMQKVMTGYTMYFNQRYERSGSLFQGKFKATHVDTDRYLRYLISYIHLNPVKLIEPKWKENGIAARKVAERYLEHYTHSSYLDYLGEIRPANIILERDILPRYFSSGNDFKSLVTEWLTYNPNEF